MSILNQQIETFIVVAETGSFRKASELLYVSPTAVLQQINLLESHLEIKLFNRSKRGLTLTPAGHSFYNDTKYLMHFSNGIIERARNALLTDKEEVRIAYSSISPAFLTKLLWPEIHKKNQNLYLSIIPVENSKQEKNVILTTLGTSIDIIESASDPERNAEFDLQFLKLVDMPIHCVIPIHESINVITQKELEQHPLILMQRGVNRYIDEVRNYLTSKKCSLIDVVDYYPEVYNAVAADNGWMISLNPTPVHPLLKCVPVSWNFTCPYGILYGKDPNLYTIEFLRLLAKIQEETDLTKYIPEDVTYHGQ
ncbi:MAG: LysR family transcriptional regulator [Solobacterium sp.]|nr:LysR family transcriptional regulator [Solobacterium sp.]